MLPVGSSGAIIHKKEEPLLKIFGKTDIGLVRHSNQDAFQKGSYSKDIAWAVVCDGMGGANGGNVASQTAVEQIARQLTSACRDHLSSQEIKDLLVPAVLNANTAIYEYAQKEPQLSGMGTTVVHMCIRDRWKTKRICGCVGICRYQSRPCFMREGGCLLWRYVIL